MLAAGEIDVLAKGPIVDSAASKAAIICSRDVKHATNITVVP